MALGAISFPVAGKAWSSADDHPAPPRSLGEVLERASASPSTHDIALVNVLCAEGLRGAEELDIPACLALLDRMARRVALETARHRYRFEHHPAEFASSEAYFKMFILIVVLQEDFGVHYNPARISPPDKAEPDDVFSADPSDILITGLLGPRRSGTVSSLPILHAGIGRRLGYPLRLVTAKAHLFLRWDDGKERLNLEVAPRGLSVIPDSYYRNRSHPISPEEEQRGLYLKNLTPAEEIALCLEARSRVLRAQKRLEEAAIALRQAALLAPRRAQNENAPTVKPAR